MEVSIHRKETAISFSDCEQMSRTLSDLLESEESTDSPVLNGSYLLEVVSAGIDRQLTSAFEYNLFAGSKVRITAKEKIASLGTEFVGVLLGGDELSISLCQSAPLTKNSKGQSKTTVKKAADINQTSEEKLTISLQKIYRIYLWPDIKEASKNQHSNAE